MQREKIIGIFSKKFTETESRYSIVEREFLAIVLVLLKFRKLLLGQEINVYTDNKNVLGENKSVTSKINRWKWIIQEYKIQIRHIKGSENTIADSLSRLNKIEIKQNKLALIIEELKLAKNHDETENALINLHIQLGHPGFKSLYNTVKNVLNKTKDFCFKKVERTIKSCITCNKIKHNSVKYGKIDGILKSEIPFDIISTDICGCAK